MPWIGSIALLLLAAFFGLLSIGHALQVQEARAIWADGKATEGTLTAQHRRKKSAVVEYSYVYRVDGRELIAEKRSIPWAAREIPVGAKLAVRYDPANPEKSVTPAELQEIESWANRALLPVLALAFLAGAIVVFVRGRKRPAT